MIEISVTVHFHAPFRVATGRAKDGYDAVLDPQRIPASTLKGVMRGAATEILGLSPKSLTRLFGSVGSASVWAWDDLELPDGPGKAITDRIRIRMDPDRGIAAEGGLLLAQELWMDRSANFTIEQVAATSSARADAELLAAAAMAVKGLGASRRRGLGWITAVPQIGGTAVTASTAAAAVQRERGTGS